MEVTPFKTIKQQKISSQIVDQIKEAISSGKLRPGDLLPPERELMRVFNVGRPTLREALNSLATMGFLDMAQRQRTKVKSLVPHDMIEPLRLMLIEDTTVALDLVESRTILETANAALASERSTEEDIAELDQWLEDMKGKLKNRSALLLSDAEFHLAIADAAHNKIQTHLMFSIYDLLKERIGLCYLDDEAELIFQQHCQIVDAIKAKDSGKAREAMRVHLALVRRQINGLLERQ
jgi:GntR family transcriptional regulator, transcriptional repressor for pyruvate dehydrogenase complex